MPDVEYFGVYDNEVSSFDMYFASICSMQFHPGAGTKDHAKISIDECMKIAVDMLILRRKLFNEIEVN